MKLQDIFDQLTVGEFSQLSIGGQDAGEINEANWPKVLNHVNLGLTQLYKRFPLKQGRFTLELQPDTLQYALNSKYAVTNRRSKEPVRFIKDSTAAPFEDDILKVERVIGESGYDLGLNDGSDPYSVFTPSSLVLRVPKDVVDQSASLPEKYKTATLEVVYRANHAKMSVGMGLFDPTRVEVELPDTHLEPLLFYVASRANTPVGMTNEANLGNIYMAKYEQSCKQLEEWNLNVDQGSQSTSFERGGWV